MKINFSMWKKALSGLVKMDSKTEWEKLDIISKWLIAHSLRGYHCHFVFLCHWRLACYTARLF
jgi:hypothetical protein